MLSDREHTLIRRHGERLAALGARTARGRHGALDGLRPDHIRAVGAGVRMALSRGHPRERGLEHLANPRASIEKKHRYMHSRPGKVAEALRASGITADAASFEKLHERNVARRDEEQRKLKLSSGEAFEELHARNQARWAHRYER